MMTDHQQQQQQRTCDLIADADDLHHLDILNFEHDAAVEDLRGDLVPFTDPLALRLITNSACVFLSRDLGIVLTERAPTGGILGRGRDHLSVRVFIRYGVPDVTEGGVMATLSELELADMVVLTDGLVYVFCDLRDGGLSMYSLDRRRLGTMVQRLREFIGMPAEETATVTIDDVAGQPSYQVTRDAQRGCVAHKLVG